MKDIEKEFVKKYLIKRGYKNNIDEEKLKEIFQWLTFQKFFENGYRDKFGRFIHNESNINFKIPYIDSLIDFEHVKQPEYPNNRQFAVCLTHDVDVVNRYIKKNELKNFLIKISNSNYLKDFGFKAYLNQSLRKLIRYSLALLKLNDPLNRYEEWLNIEDKYSCKSTFLFFSNPISESHFIDCDYSLDDVLIYNKKKVKVSNMIQEIYKSGWEIGLHGSYFSAFNLDYLLEQKRRLENIIKDDIISTRQHYLNFDYKFTPQLHEKAGFKVDSTVGFNYSYGVNQGSMHPYYLWNFEDSSPSKLFEIPLNLMDSSLFKYKNNHKELDEIIKNCITVIEFAEKTKGVVTLNWHPNYMIFKDRMIVYEIILQEIKSKKGWGTTMKEIFEFNRKKYEN